MIALALGGLALLLVGIAAYSLARETRSESGERANSIGSPPKKDRRRIYLAVGAAAAILLVGSAVTYGALRRHGSDAVSATSPEALEKQLQNAPTSAGYKQLANMYFAAGQYDKAVAADHRAIDLGANDAGTWSEFGESIVMASHGQIPPPALEAFANAISVDPNDARARFYIGMAEAQIGNLRQAVAIWRDLESGADPQAKWLPMVRQHIVAFSKQGGFSPESVTPSPPSADAMRSAVAAMRDAFNLRGSASDAAVPPGDKPASSASSQDVMIRGMVEKLVTRMETTPNDAAGWVRLAHSYNVLGEPEKARDAIAHAVRLKPNDKDVQLTLAETQKALAAPGRQRMIR